MAVGVAAEATAADFLKDELMPGLYAIGEFVTAQVRKHASKTEPGKVYEFPRLKVAVGEDNGAQREVEVEFYDRAQLVQFISTVKPGQRVVVPIYTKATAQGSDGHRRRLPVELHARLGGPRGGGNVEQIA